MPGHPERVGGREVSLSFGEQLRRSAAQAPLRRDPQVLDQLALNVERIYGVYETRVQAEQTLRQASATLTQNVAQLALTEAALTTLLTDVSAESLRAIEQTVTYGLQTVFDDQSLQFKLTVTQVRGGQSVEPVLVHGAVEAPILDAFGGGPAQVVAFLLRLIVCHRLGLFPVLLLDESFAMVSIEYVPNLAKLLRELAEKLGFTFLLVTQLRGMESFVGNADLAYRVQETGQGVTFVKA